jgi:hypothetical protein
LEAALPGRRLDRLHPSWEVHVREYIRDMQHRHMPATLESELMEWRIEREGARPVQLDGLFG